MRAEYPRFMQDFQNPLNTHPTCLFTYEPHRAAAWFAALYWLYGDGEGGTCCRQSERPAFPAFFRVLAPTLPPLPTGSIWTTIGER